VPHRTVRQAEAGADVVAVAGQVGSAEALDGVDLGDQVSRLHRGRQRRQLVPGAWHLERGGGAVSSSTTSTLMRTL
jgi:hypothetical protein